VADAELAAELAQGEVLDAAGLERGLRGAEERLAQIAVMIGAWRKLHGEELTACTRKFTACWH
jgi:hypothetical protein